MDYYEELGLARTASAQEIHQAYRVLAKLVHPDGKADEQIREMAQRQMQRLNEILAILTDEQSRRKYDASLSKTEIEPVATSRVSAASRPESSKEFARPPRRRGRSHPWIDKEWAARQPGWAQGVLRHSFWIALGLVLVTLGVWYLSQDSENPHAGAAPESGQRSAEKPQPAETAKARAIPDAKPAAPAETIATEREPVESTKTPVIPASTESAAVSAASEPASDTGADHPPEPVPPHPASKLAAGTAPPVPQSPVFAGNWLYVPDPAEKVPPGSYPATYIELLLAENHGRLAGTYRAHYRIADRAVSPEVQFEIVGPEPADKAAHLRWTSKDGANGEIDMSLEGQNGMTLSWWTTELGRHTAVASGTAKLVRQRVR